MKRLLLLLLITPGAAFAQSVTPNFTTGTMTQTVTATQTVTETSITERFGGDHYSWHGDNVEPIETGISRVGDDAEGHDIANAIEFQVVDPAHPWQLEITTRPAGIVETVDLTRTIQTDTVTNTLSVFSQ